MKKDLSQEQLAKLVGAQSKSSVSNWENGYSTPTLETAIKISRVLNKNIEFLFGYKKLAEVDEYINDLNDIKIV